MKMKFFKSVMALATMLTVPLAHADILGARFDASDGGVSDTIGGNGFYNLYLSTDNGATFINSGNGAQTAIDISTASPGSFTYQFFYSNSFANNLRLRLFLDGGTVDVSNARDTLGSSFSNTLLGSNIVHDTSNGNTVTLTSFSFKNGSGPAGDVFVTPGANYTPQLYGEFSYKVTAVAEPETYAMMLVGLGVLGAGARRRQRNAAVALKTLPYQPQPV